MRVVATAGHVDHGKSSLLRRLTGMEPDRWEEERRRGLTIDLGFVWTTFDDVEPPLTVAFVDVPGHQRFVPNMLAGAGGTGEAVLVVAADDGWSAQTEEHVAILRQLGVHLLLVAITKSDLAGPARVEAVSLDVRDRLADGAPGGPPPVVVVDSVSGRGISELSRALVQRLRDSPEAARPVGSRLWIDRSFTIQGAGAVVTGTLQGDDLAKGQHVVHAPSRTSLRIRGLQALGHPVDTAPGGSRVAVNLAGIPAGELHRGDALLAGEWPTTMAMDVVARASGDGPVGGRGAWHLHIGAAEVPVRVLPLLGDVAPNGSGPARLELEAPLPVRHGDRFVLRSAGARAIPAGGIVLDPLATARPRGTTARLEHAERLEALERATDAGQCVVALLALHGGHLPAGEVRAALGLREVPADPLVVVLGSVVVLEALLDDWQEAALEHVRSAPQERGCYLGDAVVAAGAAGCPVTLRRPVVERLCTDGRLLAHGDVLTLPDGAPAYLQARARRRRRVVEVAEREPFTPPDVLAAARDLGVVGHELQVLFDEGDLVELGGVVFAGSAVTMGLRLLADASGGDGLTAAEVRELWGTTRKFALPLLEHLSDVGLTSFDGTRHRIGATVPEGATDDD